MSRKSNRPQQTCPQCADHSDSADDAITAEALALYGSEAATAVATVGWRRGPRMRRPSFVASRDCFAGSATNKDSRFSQACSGKVSCGAVCAI